MKAFKRKLSSRTGASITFALLLFLVCSIVSSVVIVAGTAAGGQLSKMAETDQRYYAVTSASEMLKKVLEGQNVKIENETVKEYDWVSADGIEYKPEDKAQQSEAVTTTVYFNGTIQDLYSKTEATETTDDFGKKKPKIPTALVESAPILLDAACRMSQKSNTLIYDVGASETARLPYEAWYRLSVDNKSGTALVAEEKTALEVIVREELGTDGVLKLYVYKSVPLKKNSGGEDIPSDQAYTLLLTFKPVVEESKDTRNTSDTPVYSEENDNYTRRDTETIKTTTVYTWKLAGIQKSKKPTVSG